MARLLLIPFTVCVLLTSIGVGFLSTALSDIQARNDVCRPEAEHNYYRRNRSHYARRKHVKVYSR